jgi:hypothetical protein
MQPSLSAPLPALHGSFVTIHHFPHSSKGSSHAQIHAQIQKQVFKKTCAGD